MRQLPVISAFTFAVRSVLDHAGVAFRISWAWFAIIGLANVVVTLWQFRYLGDIVLDEPRGFERLPAGIQFASFLVGILSLVGFASIAVAWHRFVLLDEVPQASAYLRLDGTVWRYVGNTILITLILIAAAIVIALVAGLLAAAAGNAAFSGKRGIILALMVLFLVVYAGIAWARLSIKLPSVAIERTDFSFRDAWTASQGNSLRLFGLYLLFFGCILVTIIVSLVLFGLFAFLGPIGIALAVALQVVVQWVATIVGVGLITTLYGFFAEGRPL